MDWSALNEKFREFDELCAQLSKECRPNSRSEDDRPLQIDVSNCKGSPLLCYSVLMPNELRPITYSNVTNQLLSELLSDEWFGNTGTLLRTLEKGGKANSLMTSSNSLTCLFELFIPRMAIFISQDLLIIRLLNYK